MQNLLQVSSSAEISKCRWERLFLSGTWPKTFNRGLWSLAYQVMHHGASFMERCLKDDYKPASKKGPKSWKTKNLKVFKLFRKVEEMANHGNRGNHAPAQPFWYISITFKMSGKKCHISHVNTFHYILAVVLTNITGDFCFSVVSINVQLNSCFIWNTCLRKPSAGLFNLKINLQHLKFLPNEFKVPVITWINWADIHQLKKQKLKARADTHELYG